MRRLTLIAILAALVAIIAIAVIYSADRSLAGSRPVAWTGDDGERMTGTYTPGRLAAGVLLLEGFGSDQVTMKALAAAYARSGASVFAFDFPGHGRSGGALGFDNAATDRLALATLDALDQYARVSGLQPGQIILVGHSLGARVALQSAVMNAEQGSPKLGGLVLIGAQVNLVTNQQAEFFTGTSDAGLAWVRALNPGMPPESVMLVSGAWDDILTPQSGQALMAQLTGSADARAGQADGDPSREWQLLPRLVHNYEVFSPRVIDAALAWSAGAWGVTLAPPMRDQRAWLWVLAMLGILASLWVLGRLAGLRYPVRLADEGLRVVNIRRFVWGKLWLWLAALPLVALIFGACMFIPLGVPVFNLIYVGFIGGYGLLLLILYRAGKMPGSSGRLRRVPVGRAGWRRWGLALALNAALFALMAAYARSGWIYSPPAGDRLAWLALFTPLTALGFWVGQFEGDLLACSAPEKKGARRAAALIGFMPFFLYSILMAALGSTSGMIGGLQGLVLLLLVTLQGQSTRALIGSRVATAVLQSVLLYALILPQGVLFSM